MKSRLRLLALSIAAVLCGCASAPLVFHAATVDTPSTTLSRTHALAASVVIEPTVVPSFLDRPEIVLTRPDGTHVILENDRWTAPFGDVVHEALDDALGRKLGTIDRGTGAKNARPPTLKVQLSIRRLEARIGQSVYLEADWRITSDRDPDATPLRCRSTVVRNDAAGWPQILATQKDMLRTLFHRIAWSAERQFVTGTNDCGDE